MPSPVDIRQGLAANLAALVSAGVVGSVSPYIEDNPTPPCIGILGIDEIDYDTRGFNRGGDDWVWIIEVVLSNANVRAGWILLDKLLASSGSMSLKAAAESNKTLGGVVDHVRVTRFRGSTPKFVLPNGSEVHLASWSVEIGTSG